MNDDEQNSGEKSIEDIRIEVIEILVEVEETLKEINSRQDLSNYDLALKIGVSVCAEQLPILRRHLDSVLRLPVYEERKKNLKNKRDWADKQHYKMAALIGKNKGLKT